ncbi:MAG: BamA/TamA family outer membrane protein [Polyangiales bacterium]
MGNVAHDARRALLALTLVCLLLLVTRRAGAVGDPTLEWETIETAHFRVHTHKGLHTIGERVAAIAEDVHARLKGPMGFEPKEMVNIVLTDDTDSANGSATALPYDTVRLFVTAPDDLSPLADYDDWYLELVTHEYTHILHTDNITGLPAIYNAIVGKQYSPNQMQPRWIIEGLAVLMETKYTTGGRNRSSGFDMYLRADVLEDNIAPLDQISHSPKRWPQGNLWYLYGSHFLEYIDRVYGFEALRQVSADYGDEIIPFGINRAIHRATGKTYPELYEGWKGWMRDRYAKQKKEVLARGLREGRRVTFHGQEAYHPRYMPPALPVEENLPGFERRIAYYRNDAHTTGGLWAIGAKQNAYSIGKLITRTSGPSSPNFLADGTLFYDSVESSKMQLYFYWDLFRRKDWGAEASQGERLSWGLRATEPAVSANGDQVVYTINKAGTSYLYASEIDTPDGQPLGPPKKLWAGQRYDQAYTPRWSPDGKKIAFSAWRGGGYRDVLLYDVEKGTTEDVTHDRALDTGPVFSPDGKRLYFSSDRTGIANLYAYDLKEKTLRQVTNVINGAFQPDVSPDGKHIAYVGYTHEGYDIFEIDVDESRWLAAEEYVDTRGFPPPQPKTPKLSVKKYDPLPTLRPYTWDFTIAPDAFGDAVTVSTHGGDVLGLHTFSAAITSSFERGISGIDLSYVFRNMPFDTSVRGFRFIAPRGGYRFSDKTPVWVEQSVGITTGISAPLNTSFTSQSVAASYSFSHFKALDGFPEPDFDPYARLPVIPQTGYLGTIHLGWAWSNLQRYLYSVSTEKGFAISTGIDVANTALGGDFNVFVASYNAAAYVPMPWLQHHVFALHAQGGASTGNFARRGAFALGGFTDIPLPDAIRNLLIQPGIALRGYKPGSFFGDAFQLFNAEYRFPLLDVDRGYQTLPIFLQRFYANLFADYGMASFDPIDLTKMKLGLGGELLIDFTIGYFQPLTLRLGFAKGTSDQGTKQTYAILSQLF